jgi:hypothetical protein
MTTATKAIVIFADMVVFSSCRISFAAEIEQRFAAEIEQRDFLFPGLLCNWIRSACVLVFRALISNDEGHSAGIDRC